MNSEDYPIGTIFIRVALVKGWDANGETFELSFYMSDWGTSTIFVQPKIDKEGFMKIALKSKHITCKGNDIWYWFDEQVFLINENERSP